VKTKGFQVLLNKEADRTLASTPEFTNGNYCSGYGSLPCNNKCTG